MEEGVREGRGSVERLASQYSHDAATVRHSYLFLGSKWGDKAGDRQSQLSTIPSRPTHLCIPLDSLPHASVERVANVAKRLPHKSFRGVSPVGGSGRCKPHHEACRAGERFFSDQGREVAQRIGQQVVVFFKKQHVAVVVGE